MRLDLQMTMRGDLVDATRLLTVCWYEFDDNPVVLPAVDYLGST